MTPQEEEERWQWCAEKNPNPSCGNDGINACIRGWYWREMRELRITNYELRKQNDEITNDELKMKNEDSENQGKKTKCSDSESKQKSATVTGDSQFNGDGSNPGRMDFPTTVTTVTNILKKGLPEYEEQNLLDLICSRSVISTKAFWQLVKSLECRLDEVQSEDVEQFNQLLDWQDTSLNFNQVLPLILAEALIHDGEILNIDPISFWQYLLPTTLSLAGKRVNLNAESHIIPSIIWTCLVAESGTGKSRAEKVILDPIKQWQIQERKRWENATKEYEENKKNMGKDDPEIPPPPPEQKYIFEVATIQAVMARLAEQKDNGSLWARDELAGLFKSLGQFNSRGGENEGLECLLSMWDGNPSFVDRVDKNKNSYVADKTRLSIAGGIQPKAFRLAFKDEDDSQGLQARFLYAIPKIRPMKRVKGRCVLPEILVTIYEKLKNCPQGMINLSPEADQRLSELVDQIGLEAELSPNPAIRAWMRKFPSQLLRIALGIHLLEWCFNPDMDFFVLSVETLNRAAEFCRYYRGSFQVVQEKLADSDHVTSMLLKIHDLAASKPEGVTPRDCYRSIKALSRRAKDLGRKVAGYTVDLFKKLVDMGKGVIVQSDRVLRFQLAFDTPTPTPSPTPNPTPSPTHNPTSSPTHNPTSSPTHNPTSSPTHNPTEEKNSSVSSTEAQVNLTSPNGNVTQDQSNLNAPVSQPEDKGSENPPSREEMTVVTESTFQSEQEIEASTSMGVSPVTPDEINKDAERLQDLAKGNMAYEENPTQSSNLESTEVETNDLNSDSLTSNEVWSHSSEVRTNSSSVTNSETESDLGQTSNEVQSHSSEVRTNNFSLTNSETEPDLGQTSNEVRSPESEIQNLSSKFMETTPETSVPNRVDTNSETEPDLASTSNEVRTQNSQRQSNPVQPENPLISVEELKEMLMACQTLAQLKKLKREHHNHQEAYEILTPEQQSQVDSIAATAIPFEVFKYTGRTISENGQTLKPGELVYLDPNTKIRHNAYQVPVWLIEGVKNGWRDSIGVLKSYLIRVEKAIMGESNNLAPGRT